MTSDRVLRLTDLAARSRSLAAAPGLVAHVRSSACGARDLLVHASALRSAGLPLLVNDRVDLVTASGALGVHLPAHGLPVAAARRLLGPDALVGRSTHSPDEAREAADQGADYVFLGPIWDTPTHPDRPGIGTEAIRRAGPARVIAIGGLTPDRTTACLDAGAWGVAAITALWLADDPAAAVAAFLLCLEGR